MSTMHQENYQEIISRVQKPTRYTGNEINAVKKDWNQVDLTFALVFPDLYEIGTSHFGLQILYSILNRHETIAAERFFAPAPDMEALMKQRGIPCLSMESQIPLGKFDIIGISLLYELNYTNILTLLNLSNIPIWSELRDSTFPLIIGGGPCAFNPEPVADIFDAFVIGDGEDVVIELSRTVMEFKREGDGSKQGLLKEISKIQGVYVPSFFTPSWDENGIQHLAPVFDSYTGVKRAFLPELTLDNFPLAPIVPFGKPVHDRLRLEIARGCSRGCRFCQAGMIYRPVRERSLTDLQAITRQSLNSTGYADISLLSLSTGDYSNLAELMIRLMGLNQAHCTSISLPSVRAEKLTPELMNIIKKVRKTGFTIAPEAGSQRLRDIINKNLTEESIRSTVESALSLGWKNIKLYFMMGLPFETIDDLEAMVRLSTDLAVDYAKGPKNINVSTTAFIPKAHTPFERVSQMTFKETNEKLDFLKKHLVHKKVKLKWQDPRMSLLEGVWARGDRRLSRLLLAAWNLGCRLDGWSDYFNFDTWQRAFDQTGIDPDFYTARERNPDETLPWSHIDSGVSQAFLKKEFKHAKNRALTQDCREHDCSGCGVCDFDTIEPILNKSVSIEQEKEIEPRNDGNEIDVRLPDEAFARFEISFSKLGPARFFGHLELATIMRRALRRAGFAVKYSRGFNPSMRLSFESALPVGMESEHEIFHIFLEKNLGCNRIILLLNPQLPEGIKITGCRLPMKKERISAQKDTYLIRSFAKKFGQNQIDSLMALDTLIVEDRNKKGKVRTTDIRAVVVKIVLKDEQALEMVLRKYNERTMRPVDILVHGLGYRPEEIDSFTIRKLKKG